MKKTTSQKNIELAEEIFKAVEKIKSLKKSLDENKEKMRNLIGKDAACNFGDEYIAVLSESKNSKFDKEQAIKDGLKLDKYYTTTFGKMKVAVKKAK